ncbi:uncharacterized protein BXZ73DRAFT_38480 [Epithele typhae]|uniref:uncharacterized protein n=1 Tax=Epithele typhae TaxID=378194 RepID=UPI0020087BB8|nr:uncharacterized protein BXZ73DRAFT_38480 [Epithele typhae]KAH9945252.1 hypothetical protein BXZ73DRAFT_38480 [Epithele typhae]
MNPAERKVYLPLEDISTCGACGKNGSARDLKLCGSCKEIAYCGSECQTAHWEQHKREHPCGKQMTEYIELSSFYPIIALLVDILRIDAPGLHIAHQHELLQSPMVVELPDKRIVRLCVLGDKFDRIEDGGPESEKWWRDAPSADVRRILWRRIQSEDHLLGLHTFSVALALVAALYTTTADRARGTKRVRLQYGSSPVADFGLVRGAVDVKGRDRFAYLVDGELRFGQDPANHFWLWFRTVRGEETVLDLGMVHFNLCVFVSGLPYLRGLDPALAFPHAPSLFMGRDVARMAAAMHAPHARLSVLRDAALQRAVCRPGEPESARAVHGVLTGFGARATCAQAEAMGMQREGPAEAIAAQLARRAARMLEDVLAREAWKTWPAEVQLGIAPDEETDPSTLSSADCDRIRKLGKAFKAGKISRAEYDRKVRRIAHPT